MDPGWIRRDRQLAIFHVPQRRGRFRCPTGSSTPPLRQTKESFHFCRVFRSGTVPGSSPNRTRSLLPIVPIKNRISKGRTIPHCLTRGTNPWFHHNQRVKTGTLHEHATSPRMAMSDVRGISVDANAYLELWQERCRNHPTRKNVGLSAVWAFFQDVSDGSIQDGTHTKVKCVICDKVYSYKPSTGQHHITNHMLRSCPLHEKLYRSVEASIAARKQMEAKPNVEREKKTEDEKKSQTQGNISDGTQKSNITKENATFNNHGSKSQNNKRSGDLSMYLENWKGWASKQEKMEVDAAWGLVVERGNNGSSYFECLSCKKTIECTNKDSKAILEHASNHPLLYKHLQVEVALLQRNMENGSCQSRKRARTGEVEQVEVSQFVLTNFLRVWENSCKQHPTRKNTGLAPVWAFFEKSVVEADAETAQSGKSTVQCLVCGKTYAYSPSTGQSHIKGHMKKADSLHATLYAKLEEKVKQRRKVVAE